MYHNIDRAPSGVRMRGLYVSTSRFIHQMRFLKLLGYQGISQHEALPYLRGHKTGKVVVITFDDGYQDNLRNALPILLELGFRATCHVVSGAVGGYNFWDAEQLGTRKAIMSAPELREWAAAGMEVGSHSQSHPQLPGLSPGFLRQELLASRATLEDILGQAVRSFCYPYGAYGERERDLVQNLGFASAVTVRRERAQPGDDLWTLPRIGIGGRHLPHVILLQLMYGYQASRPVEDKLF